MASVNACGKTRVFTHTSADYSNILNKIKIHTCSTPASALITTLLGEPLITAGFSSMSPAHTVEIGEEEKTKLHCFVVHLRSSNQTIFFPAALNTSFLNYLSCWQTVRPSDVDCQGITKILQDSLQGSQRERTCAHVQANIHGWIICWKYSRLHVHIFAAICLSGVLPPNATHRAKGFLMQIIGQWPAKHNSINMYCDLDCRVAVFEDQVAVSRLRKVKGEGERETKRKKEGGRLQVQTCENQAFGVYVVFVQRDWGD